MSTNAKCNLGTQDDEKDDNCTNVKNSIKDCMNNPDRWKEERIQT